MAVAQATEADYGDVLWYAEWVSRGVPHERNVWMERALQRMTFVAAHATAVAALREDARREAVALTVAGG